VKPSALLAALALVVCATGVWAITRVVEDDFAHSDHDGLFPLCQGCHQGIETGAEAEYYPDPASCTACHDGEVEGLVAWSGPTIEPTNLDYSHPEHMAEIEREGEVADCTTCHQLPGDSIAALVAARALEASLDPGGAELVQTADETPRMFVGRADPESCVTCHAHEAPEHITYVQDCAVCHQSLWEATDLGSTRIAAFPEPTEHEDKDFILEHGDLEAVAGAACATCHTRDSCERCHVNSADIPDIARLQFDARVAGLVHDEPSEYPEPEDHETSEWSWDHSEEALADVAGCANCHTQPTCTSCHREVSNEQVASLPLPVPGGAAGVEWEDGAPEVHRSDFATTHGAGAASGEGGCLGCHVQETCTACHEGADKPAFHQRNFMEMHGPEVYGNEVDCASCHNPEVFCRACHQGVGLTSEGGIDIAFHSANPFWLLGHGVAARQGLEGCVTCHSQVDCTQCHSAVGGWGISPHGPGFDPDRAMEASREGCVKCHGAGARE
jgi:hypothetical protein